MPGYLGTPLPKKLGIKAGYRVCLVDAPADVRSELTLALKECQIAREDDDSLDFVMRL
jgi:hypothetical protein